VVVVDPPRKGCDEVLLDTILKMNPKRIVYVSCDSATLARDLKYLTANGYEVQKVQPVDQFGHSVHVETVVLLSQQKPDDRSKNSDVMTDMDGRNLIINCDRAESQVIFDEPEDEGILARLARKEPASYVSIAMRSGGLQDYVE
jgi:23S rRNA (uracil1939-C5)-methyltransferase